MQRLMPKSLVRVLRSTQFRLFHPFASTGHPNSFDPALARRVREELASIIRPFDLKAEGFWNFKKECGYAESYVSYMGADLLNQKLLEHFVSLEITRPRAGETLIDIGSAQSPFAEYVGSKLGVDAYSLDPAYPAGVHGRRIGSGAEAIPLPEDSVDVMTLHCTIDHFESDRDTRFIREAARVLRRGGRICILPVYFAPEPTNICDPALFASDIGFDPGIEIRRVPGHANRFGRYYSLETFRARILAAEPSLSATLWTIEGEQRMIPNNYLHYALELKLA